MTDNVGAESPPANWYPDPMGRHQYRYWDGAQWTQHVADDGVVAIDEPAEAQLQGERELAGQVNRPATREPPAEVAGSATQTDVTELATQAGVAGPVPRVDVKATIKALAHGGSSSARDKAAQALGAAGDQRAVKPLIGALNDQFESVRAVAAQALGRLGDSHAVEPLIPLLKDRNEAVRKSAAAALGRIGDPRAIGPLSSALRIGNKEDKEEGMRSIAARALGEIGDVRAVETLIGEFKLSMGSPISRAAVVEALDRIGPPAVAPLLAALLAGDRDSSGGTWVAQALARVGGERVVEPLVAALASADGGVRCCASEALGRIGDPRAVEPLVGALADEHLSVRANAARALGQIGDARAVQPLVGVLHDGEPAVRRAATGALARIGPPAIEPLVAALQDEDPPRARSGLRGARSDRRRSRLGASGRRPEGRGPDRALEGGGSPRPRRRPGLCRAPRRRARG